MSFTINNLDLSYFNFFSNLYYYGSQNYLKIYQTDYFFCLFEPKNSVESLFDTIFMYNDC